MALFRCGGNGAVTLGQCELQYHGNVEAGKIYLYSTQTTLSATPPTVTINSQNGEEISRTSDTFTSSGGATIGVTQVLFKALNTISCDSVATHTGGDLFIVTPIN